MTEMETKRLEGKVAQILNERELVINIGTEIGVIEGMLFEVLADQPLTITDPDDDTKVLGIYDRPKVRVEAFEVQPHMSICQTYETITTPGNLSWQLRNAMSFSAIGAKEVPPTVTAITLRSSDDQFPAPLPQSESYVKRGDRVREYVKPVGE